MAGSRPPTIERHGSNRAPRTAHRFVSGGPMSSTLSRRDFVATSAGLVIAFHLPSRSPRADIDDAPFSPNAWIHIGSDGIVTLTVDKSEIGQVSQTSLAMILAEELDADWSTVRLRPGPENPARWSRRPSRRRPAPGP